MPAGAAMQPQQQVNQHNTPDGLRCMLPIHIHQRDPNFTQHAQGGGHAVHVAAAAHQALLHRDLAQQHQLIGALLLGPDAAGHPQGMQQGGKLRLQGDNRRG